MLLFPVGVLSQRSVGLFSYQKLNLLLDAILLCVHPVFRPGPHEADCMKTQVYRLVWNPSCRQQLLEAKALFKLAQRDAIQKCSQKPVMRSFGRGQAMLLWTVTVWQRMDHISRGVCLGSELQTTSSSGSFVSYFRCRHCPSSPSQMVGTGDVLIKDTGDVFLPPVSSLKVS